MEKFKMTLVVMQCAGKLHHQKALNVLGCDAERRQSASREDDFLIDT